MAIPLVNIHDVPQAIQLALGPVFLLTGIAAALNVMTGRLARIIDRARNLTEDPALAAHLGDAVVESELRSLERRRRMASTAITACTLAALLVCMVIATLFLEVLLEVPLKWPIALLFTAATFSLVVGLGSLLREVQLATLSVRFSRQVPPEATP